MLSHTLRAPLASLFFTALFLACVDANAISFRATNDFFLAKTDTLTGQTWLSAKTIDIQGTVRNELVLMAGNADKKEDTPTVRLGGVFMNDVAALGDHVVLDGEFHDHARVMGRDLRAEGVFSNNCLFAGESIIIARDAVIGGDFLAIGNDITVKGNIDGDLLAKGSRITLSGRVAGDVDIEGLDIVIMPGAVIGGNISYTSGKELILDRQVQLGGELTRRSPVTDKPGGFVQSLVSTSYYYLAALICGIVFVAVFPGGFNRCAARVRSSAWKCLLAGFVTLAILAVSALFLMFTIVGIPLALILLFSCCTLAYVGKIACGVALGCLLLRRQNNPGPASMLLCLSTGLLLIYVAVSIPSAGSIVWLAATLVGAGAILFSLFTRMPWATQRPEPPPLPGLGNAGNPDTDQHK